MSQFRLALNRWIESHQRLIFKITVLRDGHGKLPTRLAACVEELRELDEGDRNALIESWAHALDEEELGAMDPADGPTDASTLKAQLLFMDCIRVLAAFLRSSGGDTYD